MPSSAFRRNAPAAPCSSPVRRRTASGSRDSCARNSACPPTRSSPTSRSGRARRSSASSSGPYARPGTLSSSCHRRSWRTSGRSSPNCWPRTPTSPTTTGSFRCCSNRARCRRTSISGCAWTAPIPIAGAANSSACGKSSARANRPVNGWRARIREWFHSARTTPRSSTAGTGRSTTWRAGCATRNSC